MSLEHLQQQHADADVESNVGQSMELNNDDDDEDDDDDKKDSSPPIASPKVAPPTDSTNSPTEANTDTSPPPVTLREKCNLTACLLAWACTVCNVTLVVGTSAMAILSVDDSVDNLASIPLAAFFLGASLVSLCLTPWLFSRLGRKHGFLIGILLGLIGTALGTIAIAMSSPALVVVAFLFFGASMGVGFYLRFAAVEIVPSHWSSKAVTLVVSGGVIAAIAGPESAGATVHLFPQYPYMGVMMMTGIFGLANAIFTLLIQFPDHDDKNKDRRNSHSHSHCDPSSSSSTTMPKTNRTTLFKMLQTRQFLVPMLLSGLAWGVMAMPMSIVRVAMQNAGYTSRQSLTVIEAHFLGMYAPGFFTGHLISRLGPWRVSAGGVVGFALSLVSMFLVSTPQGGSGSTAAWFIGLILVGISWSCAFTSTTVWTTSVYTPDRLEYKSWVQAANDCGMFFLAGCFIFSASFIYQAGGSGLEGWYTLCFVLFGLMCLMICILVVDKCYEHGVLAKRIATTALSRLSTEFGSDNHLGGKNDYGDGEEEIIPSE